MTIYEVTKMEKLLAHPQFINWSIASIHHYARRNKMVISSLSTWYKYNRLMKWRKTRFRQKKKNLNPLIANKPNQYWHMDITVFRTKQGDKFYIQTLIDNYSRKVLGWNVSDHIRGKDSVLVIKQAIQKVVKYYPNFSSNLIVDGGIENHNHAVEKFLSNHPIIKLTALKDIASSNSMIEANNKHIKYNCLYKKQIITKKDLINALEALFEEDNAIRPHHALNGLTPDEVYIEKKNPALAYFDELLSQARLERMQINRDSPCRLCS